MPRLKFDLKPRNRDEDEHYQTREENDEWVRRCWSNWEREGEPRPCDCGFYSDQWLVTCDDKDRVRCKRDALKHLEQGARYKHLKALKKKREFPALPPNTEKGQCYWCKKPMVHGRVYQRAMHDGRLDEPNCRYAYETHTRLEVQQSHLLDRDGLGCKSCGVVVGRWGNRVLTSGDRLRGFGEKYLLKYPETVWAGEFQWIEWQTGLEVDHRIALAVAFECFPDPNRRRWFFGPGNLQAICPACHKAKTNEDRALLRQVYANGPEWGRTIVLDMLGRAGLLKGRQTGGEPPCNANAPGAPAKPPKPSS